MSAQVKHRELVIQLQHLMTTLMPCGLDWHLYTIQEDHISVGLIQAFATFPYIHMQTLTLLAEQMAHGLLKMLEQLPRV